MSELQKVAIIGAGISGLVLAEAMQAVAEVSLFEKSGGLGGRLATRRLDDYQFDHGATFFTARSKEFKNWLKPFLASGVVQPWVAKVLTFSKGATDYKRDWFEPHYVAVPTMTALPKKIAENLYSTTPIALSTKITTLDRDDKSKWWLNGCQGPFDWVISTAPSPQTQEFFPISNFSPLLSKVEFQPCLALLVGFPIEFVSSLNFSAARCKDDILDWISVEHSRPRRPAKGGLTLQTQNQFAKKCYELEDGELLAILLRRLGILLKRELPLTEQMSIKRWKYAQAIKQEEPLCCIDTKLRLAACGDWTQEGRVEAAFLSARNLAQRLFSYLPDVNGHYYE